MTCRLSVAGRWLVMFGWAAVIFVLSSQPRLPELPPIPYLDKVAHFAAYGVLAWMCFRAFCPDKRRRISAWLVLVAVVLVSTYGVAEEFHQKTVPGRTFDELDMVANALGAIIAAALWHPLTKRCRWAR